MKFDRYGRLATSSTATLASVVLDPAPPSIEIAGGVSLPHQNAMWFTPRTAKVSLLLLLIPHHLRLAYYGYIS